MAVTMPVDQSGKRRRLAIIVGVASFVAVTGTAMEGLARREADERGNTLAADVRQAFGETSLAEVRKLWIEFRSSGGEPLDQFLRRPGVRPDFFQTKGNASGPFVAKYSIEYWGEDRCILVDWTSSGVAFRKESDGGCPTYFG